MCSGRLYISKCQRKAQGSSDSCLLTPISSSPYSASRPNPIAHSKAPARPWASLIESCPFQSDLLGMQFLSTFPLLLLLQESTPAWTFLRKISLSPNLDVKSPCSALALLCTDCHGSPQSARSLSLSAYCLSDHRLQRGRQHVLLMAGCPCILTTWLLRLDKWQRRPGGIVTEGPALVISQVIGRPLKDKYRQKTGGKDEHSRGLGYSWETKST